MSPSSRLSRPASGRDKTVRAAAPPDRSTPDAGEDVSSRPGITPSSKANAYADLWLLLLIALLRPAGHSLLYFAETYGLASSSVRTGLDTVNAAHALLLAVVPLWLTALVVRRTRDAGLLQQRVLRCAAAVTGSAALWTVIPWLPNPSSQTLEVTAFSVALAWLALEVCLRHGITAEHLGIRPLRQRTAAGRRAENASDRLTLAIFLLNAAAMDLVARGLWEAGIRLPQPPDSVQELAKWTSAWDLAATVLRAVVIEDLVVIAAVSALLAVARRPAWHVYAIAAGAGIALHAHFGLLALCMLPYTLYRVRIYRRYGLLLSLVVIHVFWDVFWSVLHTLTDRTFTSQQWFLVLAGAGAVILVEETVRRGAGSRTRDAAGSPQARRKHSA
ncbi:hypothetical protein [Streptomyces sp. NPDC056672]|uniref:hypothetical protein n=1 Tax=Streptomyces sp. NPDC056672 TaxID=3345906 RepID=UPI0036BD9D48